MGDAAPKIGEVAKLALIARVWTSYVRVRLALRRYPLPLAVRRLDDRRHLKSPRLSPRRLGRIVDRVLTIGPWRARCLHSSLVLYQLVGRNGGPVELVIGMPARPEDEIAHAWVEVDGVDVGPPPGSVGHLQLARYP